MLYVTYVLILTNLDDVEKHEERELQCRVAVQLTAAHLKYEYLSTCNW